MFSIIILTSIITHICSLSAFLPSSKTTPNPSALSLQAPINKAMDSNRLKMHALVCLVKRQSEE